MINWNARVKALDCNYFGDEVKVVFEDGTGKTVKTLDGKSSKTVKEIKGGSTSQQKKYAAALNQYDDTNKGSEKGDEQNYNKLVSAKQIGGKDLQTNNCLIWRISNSKARTDGFKISAKSSKYVNWKAKVYIYKKSGSGASAIWTNVLSGKQVKGKTVKASNMGNGDYTETNSVIAQYIGKESNPEDDKDVNLSGTYESTPEAYAELKEGSVYNETFEAMAGTPSTRSLYFATGGSEFIVNMQYSRSNILFTIFTINAELFNSLSTRYSTELSNFKYGTLFSFNITE